jgi:hypothetical protein
MISVFFAVLAAFVMIAATTARPASSQLYATELRNADSIRRYDILELTFKHNGIYQNNFFDVTLDVSFTSPSGSRRQVRGFFYGNDLWKVRFVPDEVGRWTYTYVIIGKGGFRKEGDGTFNSTPSNAKGPVRRHADNPYRWVFADGEPYFPVGLQDCIGASGSHLPIDGEGRTDKPREVSHDEYFAIYVEAGFNLLRFSQQNCSFSLYDDLDHYRESESIAVDKLLSLARKHGFRIMFGFFGFHHNRSDDNGFLRKINRITEKAIGLSLEPLIDYELISKEIDYDLISKEKRFIDYAVARWGVYVDFWELLNERSVSGRWTTVMAEYVRAVDPYRRPISTSWEKPYLPAIDINAPHWYERESEFQSDVRVAEQASKWKAAGKSVIVGEQGNTGMNWDPLSGRRMRIRAWTALFQEISLVFWNTSWSKAGMFEGRYNPKPNAANIYLGPEERKYIRVLQDFSGRLHGGVRMVSVESSSPNSIRAYGLFSNVAGGVYLHHFNNHTSAVHRTKITIDFPGSEKPTKELIGEWIEPSSGRVLKRVRVRPGRQTLDVPSFIVDLAFLITS